MSPSPAPVAHLVSVGTCLPGEPVDNATLAKLVGVDEQWAEMFIGNVSRHFAVDLATGQVRHSLADIAATAADRALAAAGLEAVDIDCVVMGTATPDQLMPATVNLVADRLGIDNVPTYQLQSGCAGAVQALDVARTLLLAGRCSTVLVIGGDVCAKHLETDFDPGSRTPGELVNYILFGDGAGAAVLSAESFGERVEIRQVLNRLVGLGKAPGQVIDWFGLGDRHSDRIAISEDYKAIEAAVPVLATQMFWELIGDVGWTADQVDYLLPPQLSGRMSDRISDAMPAPLAQRVNVVRTVGNNGNALPFLQLAELLGRWQGGGRAVTVAVESSKWIKSGIALERA
ncbi:3-oxoacyl-ACP synthase III family protein [Streptomyces melanogenes]|uniref:3-oxoacyl-ACP synthase III family protein n=1 Tax=Streptomyces melanogenes TaxID=67326 RepID=UPI00167D46F0|nr:3-oxoacyl-ACP synthase III family protein [Streptomyces melanogenes]GGP44874.1 3-oxoacyl-[acyl-carrier-protein] synthase III [Streptomyces melanogenes]